MRDKSRLEPVAEILAAYLDRTGLKKRLDRTRVIDEWPELVGPQIAAVTEPQAVSADGILWVRVATAPWATELGLMTPRILARVNATRQGRITSIRWVTGMLSRTRP